MSERMHNKCGPECPAHADPKAACDFEVATERDNAALRTRLAAAEASLTTARGLLGEAVEAVEKVARFHVPYEWDWTLRARITAFLEGS